MRKVQDTMYRHLDEMCEILGHEVGRPRLEAYLETACALECIAFQRRVGPKLLGGHPSFIPILIHRRHRIEYRPFGVVALIMPWNFPVIQVIAPMFAALLAGNSVVFKPSEYAVRMGELMVKIFHEGGIPPDVLQSVYGYGDIGAALIHAKPDRIAFTGSVPTGRKVAKAAAELLIPVSLELGSKDAAIVLSDADIPRTAIGVTWGGLLNAGQACLSVERVYVERSVYQPLVDAMHAVIKQYVTINEPGRTLGALTHDAQLRIVESQVEDAVSKGARVICGGHREAREGLFYAPTILTEITDEMKILHEETFGPVITVIPVESAEEAIHLTNAANCGLTASIWTRDSAKGVAVARKLRVGHAGINDHVVSASDPRLPWGGVGDAGYGRERGREGLLGMVYPQAISQDRFVPPINVFWYPYTRLKVEFLRRLQQALFGHTWRVRVRAFLP
jgi:acyl-CoA reductase-like NAD-dependent aldehyde dehydrogenase